jgi:flagellar hook-associated protein 3 FlgL
MHWGKTMRISTNQMQLSAVGSILDQQSKLNHTQMQVATGKRVVNPSDDPVASAAVLSLQQSKSQTERYVVNADAAKARLSIEEGTLTGVTEQLQRVRELAIYGNNSHISNSDRESMAKELRQILDEVMGLANSTDNNGQYLFAGNQGNTTPFSQTPTGFQYNGDSGQRFLQIGPSRRVADADPGNEVFMNVLNGNGVFRTSEGVHLGTGVIDAGSVVDKSLYIGHNYTINFADNNGDTIADEYTVVDNISGATVVAATPYTSGASIAFDGIQVSVSGAPNDADTFTITPSSEQDIFSTINNLITAFETPVTDESSQAKLNNAVNRNLVDLDQSLANVLNIRADIGARLNAVDDQNNNSENFLLQVDESISVLSDLDYAEAISRLNLQLVGLEASQKAFTRVQNLSLFNYI